MTTAESTIILGTYGYSPGLEGVPAGETAICQLDEGGAGLRYRGYAIGDLAARATFEEVAYLLLRGTLPTKSELKDFSSELASLAVLPDRILAFLATVPRDTHPMDLLRTAVSWLGLLDREPRHPLREAQLRASIALLTQIPLVIGTAHRLAMGDGVVTWDPGMGFAENLLSFLTGQKGDGRARAMARALEVSLILYAEHEFNASTFSARVTASTMTDLHSAVTAAIGTLKGPLHGGANEAVAEMFVSIGNPNLAEAWVKSALAEKRRIMGFGHRVLKQGDVRSDIIQREAERLSDLCGERRWYDIARAVDLAVRRERGLHPNLDFYTAVVYLLMGIPRVLYTPVFVCSRIAGWCAHIIEQQEHNRLIRPRALYKGPAPEAYVELDDRR
ncbi:MAG: citrate synthase [Nitrospira sp.]|nr:citrate synthase [Nitrospira sp.]MCP9441997.1 citrate synthase [Nitrospira sp.]